MAAAGAGTIVVVAVVAALLAVAPFETAAGAEGPSVAAGVATAASSPPQPGNVLASVLDGLVQDQVITQDQADTIATRLRERHADLKEQRDQRFRMRRVATRLFSDLRRVLLESTGFDREEFAAAWRKGDTLGEIAGAAGVTREAAISALTESAEDRIDSWLSSGRITVEQAERLREQAVERAPEIVSRLWERSRTDRTRTPYKDG
jgi:polyhydroxyalkanoate synthesis regulator phasin